ncbi:hypothetical protein EDEG_01799 [Edhazardia aedis USNM 41457]|uniref:Uncharacterized protein n=1 Tax=Edhazardia aedis (strain USNM 41457) TaxID=1003232 RepID=J9DMV9_EDHAE|nr:hypothetical protein EDEG_01799 [Edhazardia aedis USNM 41457]|eukprot:EJW03905.1 hypothetical protein EDEG_01799 [Edhazardia aedis USNM 41457]
MIYWIHVKKVYNRINILYEAYKNKYIENNKCSNIFCFLKTFIFFLPFIMYFRSCYISIIFFLFLLLLPMKQYSSIVCIQMVFSAPNTEIFHIISLYSLTSRL